MTAPGPLGRVLRGGAWLTAGSVAGAVLLLVQGIVTTRALGPSGFGALAIVIAVVTTVRMLLSFRMNELVVVALSRAHARNDPVLAAAALKTAAFAEAASALVAWTAVAVLAFWAARVFGGAIVEPRHILLYALIIPAGMVAESALGVLQGCQRFALQSAAQTAERAVALLGAAVAAWWGGGLDAFVLAAAVSSATGSVIVVALALRVARDRLGPKWSEAPLAALRGRWREGMTFAASTNAGATLSLLSKEGDALWLGLLRSPADAGLYRLAYNVASMLFLPVTPLAQAVYPEAANLIAAGRQGELRALIARGSRYASVFAAGLALASLALGRWALAAVYGPEFAPAAPALAVLLLGMGISSAAFWARPVLLATGQASFAVAGSAAATLVRAAGVVALVPRFGVTGNAWSLAAAYAAGVGLLARRALRTLRDPRPA